MPNHTETPALYRIEFGPAWPVPPITVDYSDPNTAARTVAEHAIPHLRPVLAEKGRPELADCFFHTDRDRTGGHFLWLDLAGEKATPFCPARLSPLPLDDCIWLQRRPCGCIVSAVVAVVPDAWTLATAEEAGRHFNPTDGERGRASAAGLTVVPVSGREYRERYRARWRCAAHARPVVPAGGEDTP